MRLFLCVAFVVAACGGGGGGGGGPDGEPDADPTCHWDCFGRVECVDGVVTVWIPAPVPCEEWDGECPHEEPLTCAKGCRADADAVDFNDAFDDPSIVCEENRPKQVGDPCDSDEDCRPEVATWDDAGVVTNVYLRCDVEAGQCVARDPPVVPDWLAPCGLAPTGMPGAIGVAETEACTGGLCLFAEGDTCVAQGCTIACLSDGECPPGSVCQDSVSVCTPGPPGWLGDGLSCPP